MMSRFAIALVLSFAVPLSLASVSSEASLETALQHDDNCANGDESSCSVEFLQRRAAAKDAADESLGGEVAETEEVDANDADLEEDGAGQAAEEEVATSECCRYGKHRTCTKHRHCENGHCQTVKHCHTERRCTSFYRQRRTCTKHRHCENSPAGRHCHTERHCHTSRYCSPNLLQEGEEGTEEEQGSEESGAADDEETGLAEEAVVEEDDGSADEAKATDEENFNELMQNLAEVQVTMEDGESGCHASNNDLRSCGTPCFSKHAGSSRSDCIARCLHSKKHLGDSCAKCYGKTSDCTMVHCISPCMASANGGACKKCVHSHCGGNCR